MSTRSVVAVPLPGGGWKGRYVHFDGYPSGVGSALAKIVQRDGYEKAVQTLTQDHYGWSTVDGEDVQERYQWENDGRFEAVPGYGIAYTDTVIEGFGFQPGYQQVTSDDWITESGDDQGTEYAYVLHPDSLRVLERTGGGAFGWTHRLSRKYVDYDEAMERAR